MNLFFAANKARQALRVFWNNGGHGMSTEVPEVITPDELLEYRLDRAFVVFSDNSDNRDYAMVIRLTEMFTGG